jgi:hypothetical protein
MTLRAYLFLVFVVFISGISFSQLIIKEAEFTPKTVLSKIFQGEFQNDQNVQKWPVSSVHALEMDNYIDAKNFAYTSVDTILNFSVDTTNYKIAVFASFQVDSSGWIQDYMFSQIQIGMAYFEKRESDFYLIKLNSNVSTTTQGSRPKSRIEEIGTSKFALVLKEEIVRDCGREYWFEILKEGFPLFLTYDYQSLITSEQSMILENNVKIIPSENEYFDLIINSKLFTADDFDSSKAKNIKTVTTKVIFGDSEIMQHFQIPFRYLTREN